MRSWTPLVARPAIAVDWWIASASAGSGAAIGATVQAVATIALAAVGVEAMRANRQLVVANYVLVAAAEHQAEA